MDVQSIVWGSTKADFGRHGGGVDQTGVKKCEPTLIKKPKSGTTSQELKLFSTESVDILSIVLELNCK